jgi:nucleotide-binding universal stress UspA family protein
MIKRILVGLGSENYAHSATLKAIELAQQHGAALTGVTLFDPERLDDTGPIPIGAGHLAKELRENRLKHAEETMRAVEVDYIATCQAAGVSFEVDRREGDPLDSLISLARYHDLIICGLQSLFEHADVGEPSPDLAKLVEEGVRPLIAVPENDRPIQRVLVAYSGSMESAKTMKRFVQMRLWPKATIRIVTFLEDQQLGAQRVFEAAEYCRAHGLEPETECVALPPLDNLLPYADDWEADLIVLGNSAKNMLLRRILGETALYVMMKRSRAT